MNVTCSLSVLHESEHNYNIIIKTTHQGTTLSYDLNQEKQS